MRVLCPCPWGFWNPQPVGGDVLSFSWLHTSLMFRRASHCWWFSPGNTFYSSPCFYCQMVRMSPIIRSLHVGSSYFPVLLATQLDSFPRILGQGSDGSFYPFFQPTALSGMPSRTVPPSSSLYLALYFPCT